MRQSAAATRTEHDAYFRLTGGHLSEVGLVHNEMRFEAKRGDLLTKYALHTHFLAYVRSIFLLNSVPRADPIAAN